jgi:hypothetical protein
MEFVQAMPDEYKVPGNAVQAYRNCYIAFASWAHRNPPKWFIQAIESTKVAPLSL